MNQRPYSSIPVIAIAVSLGLAAFALAPAAPEDHATLATAFPIAQAQFAR